jgi:hypothetical protein
MWDLYHINIEGPVSKSTVPDPNDLKVETLLVMYGTYRVDGFITSTDVNSDLQRHSSVVDCNWYFRRRRSTHVSEPSDTYMSNVKGFY